MSEDTTEVTEEVTDTDNETEVTEETPTVETLQAELEKVQASLKKAKQEKERLIRKTKDTKPDQSTPDQSEVIAPWKTAVAITTLKAEGLNDSQAKRLVKLLDLSEVELVDGELTGLDTDEIKEDFPELFAKGPEKKTVRKVDTSDKKEKATPPSVMSEATKKMLGLV